MKISIITSTLNCADQLRPTLDSIVNQSYQDVELVIVDGGSTDSTIDIIREYALRYPERVRWMSCPDRGVYQALNRGVTLSTGDVVGLLHAGDRYSSNDVLSKVAKAFEDGACCTYGDLHYENRHGRITRYYSSRNFYPERLYQGFPPPHPSLYMTRELYDRVGPYCENYIICGDFDYFVRLMLVHKVDATYLPIDMVAMSPDGLSGSWRHRLTTNFSEKYRALRSNGLRASRLRLLRKYWEILTRQLWKIR